MSLYLVKLYIILMELYKMTPQTVKMIYDWFHKAYPDYLNNEDCSEKEMLLISDLEQYLIDNE